MMPKFFSKSKSSSFDVVNDTSKKRRHIKWFFGFLCVVLVLGGVAFWKAGSVLKRIAPNGNIFSSIINSLPLVDKELKGEKDGRINIVLLGMRGKGVEGGGLLSDTIMILSFHPKSGEGDVARASLVSIPRDLYVTVPGTSDKQKINAVHHYGEQKGDGQGLEAMKTVLSEVTGQPMHYVASIDFKGFEELIDAVGGVSVTLKDPFTEPMQFREPHVCDPNVFTIPTNPLQYENKYVTTPSGRKRIVKSYPLCYNKDVECGGVFDLPAGTTSLDGERALCFARARVTSNDFERAKRQHMILEALREKLLSIGTLSDFSKINAMLESLGDNARTDMEAWELKQFFDIYLENKDVKISQDAVIDNSENGFLYVPENSNGAGYILLPKGDTYDRIHEFFRALP